MIALRPPSSGTNNLENLQLLPEIRGADQFNKCVIALIDRNTSKTSVTLEVAKMSANLFVITITGLGIPLQNSANLSVRILVVGDTSCIGWSGFNYLNYHLRNHTPSEKALIGKQPCHKPRAVNQVIFETAIAFSSHLPELIHGLQNSSLSFDGKVSIITELIGDSFFRMYSIQLTIQAIPAFFYSFDDSVKARVFWMKREFAQEVQNMKEDFIMMSYEQKMEFLRSIQEVRRLDNEPQSQKAHKYFALITKQSEAPHILPQWQKRALMIGKAVLFLGFVVFPATFPAATNWYMSKEAGFSNGGAGVLSILPYSALYLATRCSLRAIRQFFPMKYNLTTQLKKVTSLAFKALGSAFSLIAAYGFSASGYGSEYPDAKVLTIPYYWYIFTIYNTAIYDFIDHTLEQSLLAGENEIKRNLVMMKREFEKVILLIEKTPLDKFADTVLEFPPFIKNHLLQKFRLDEEELRTFIQKS